MRRQASARRRIRARGVHGAAGSCAFPGRRAGCSSRRPGRCRRCRGRAGARRCVKPKCCQALVFDVVTKPASNYRRRGLDQYCVGCHARWAAATSSSAPAARYNSASRSYTRTPSNSTLASARPNAIPRTTGSLLISRSERPPQHPTGSNDRRKPSPARRRLPARPPIAAQRPDPLQTAQIHLHSRHAAALRGPFPAPPAGGAAQAGRVSTRS